MSIPLLLKIKKNYDGPTAVVFIPVDSNYRAIAE